MDPKELVGKVFYDSWGYDQTNIDFIKVVQVSPSGKPVIDCKHWGENRADELYFDVGCVIGHSWCDPEKCPDYEKASQ